VSHAAMKLALWCLAACAAVNPSPGNAQDLENLKRPITRKNLSYKGPAVPHVAVEATWADDGTATAPLNTRYNKVASKNCCATQCDAMTTVISTATEQDVADCKMGCGMWLASSSLNYESTTWWPQLHHKCKQHCSAGEGFKALRVQRLAHCKKANCDTGDSMWEKRELIPASAEMCETGCDGFFGCMNQLESE